MRSFFYWVDVPINRRALDIANAGPFHSRRNNQAHVSTGFGVKNQPDLPLVGSKRATRAHPRRHMDVRRFDRTGAQTAS